MTEESKLTREAAEAMGINTGEPVDLAALDALRSQMEQTDYREVIAAGEKLGQRLQAVRASRLSQEQFEALCQWAETTRLFDPGTLLIALAELRFYRDRFAAGAE